jgi:hypothetical protein
MMGEYMGTDIRRWIKKGENKKEENETEERGKKEEEIEAISLSVNVIPST